MSAYSKRAEGGKIRKFLPHPSVAQKLILSTTCLQQLYRPNGKKRPSRLNTCNFWIFWCTRLDSNQWPPD